MFDNTINIGNYIYHPDRRCLVINGVVIRIAENEDKLLRVFIENRNKIVSKETILSALWGEKHVIVDQGSVNTTISKLRKCFNDSSNDSRFIKTVRGQGYILVADVNGPSDCTEENGSEHNYSIKKFNDYQPDYLADREHHFIYSNLMKHKVLYLSGMLLFLVLDTSLLFSSVFFGYNKKIWASQHAAYNFITHSASESKVSCAIKHDRVECRNE